VSVSALSAAQVSGLATMCQTSVTPPANPAGAQCFSSSNSLSGTISDNTTYAVMASYNFGAPAPTLYAGYEHISFANPTNPYEPGQVIIGGYVLAYVNNNAYGPADGPASDKILQVYWAGLKWPITPQLDLIAAYYGYKQNSYATGKDAGCSTSISSGCSGMENTASALLDYRFSKRFDAYIGTFWSEVEDGLAAGYQLTDLVKGVSTTSSASTVTTTMGIRFRF
jgi:predicted porin